jgi:ABC-type hemin transport system substrate-binding protein
VVGDLYEIDYERLLTLQPTKVLVQETIVGVDNHLKELAEKHYFSLHAWEINRFDDISKLHDDLLQLFDKEGESLNLEIEPIEISLPSPVLIMTSGSEGITGLCFGKQTYLDDLLTLIGGENALHQSGWLSLSLEDIVNLQPALIMMVSDTHFRVPDGIQSLDIPTIQFIHEDVLIPSSKIARVAEEFREKLLMR